MFICAPLFGVFLRFPSLRPDRKKGRQAGRRKAGGTSGWLPPQHCASLLSWLRDSQREQDVQTRLTRTKAGRLTWFFFLDECEEVEHQCQKTIQQLETILGEPLQSYFWNSGFGYFVLCSGIRLLFHIFILGVQDHITFGALTLLGLRYKIPSWSMRPQKPFLPVVQNLQRVNDTWYFYTDCCVCFSIDYVCSVCSVAHSLGPFGL